MYTVKLTKELIETLTPQSGCFDYVTMRHLGVKFPLQHGWYEKMIDTEISEDDCMFAIESTRAYMLKLAKRDVLRVSRGQPERAYKPKKEKIKSVKCAGGQDCRECGMRTMQRYKHPVNWKPHPGKSWTRYWDKCECGHMQYYPDAYVKGTH